VCAGVGRGAERALGHGWRGTACARARVCGTRVGTMQVAEGARERERVAYKNQVPSLPHSALNGTDLLHD
jgi:hypothetical protein